MTSVCNTLILASNASAKLTLEFVSLKISYTERQSSWCWKIVLFFHILTCGALLKPAKTKTFSGKQKPDFVVEKLLCGV